MILADNKVIGAKQIYKTKLNSNKTIQKYKARLVTKGYTQKFGKYYNKTFAPIARLDTIKTLIALATKKKQKNFQLDVKSAFLNEELQEEVYVSQPERFRKALGLKKALYSLKQTPQAWHGKIYGYFLDQGFQMSKNEHTLYTKH